MVRSYEEHSKSIGGELYLSFGVSENCLLLQLAAYLQRICVDLIQ